MLGEDGEDAGEEDSDVQGESLEDLLESDGGESESESEVDDESEDDEGEDVALGGVEEEDTEDEEGIEDEEDEEDVEGAGEEYGMDDLEGGNIDPTEFSDIKADYDAEESEQDEDGGLQGYYIPASDDFGYKAGTTPE